LKHLIFQRLGNVSTFRKAYGFKQLFRFRVIRVHFRVVGLVERALDDVRAAFLSNARTQKPVP
jgi:hypothetical protein